MRSLLPVLLTSVLLLSGCYQAQMTTGKRPSETVVEEKWAPSYLYGLVPAEIDVSEDCPNGIASAERNFPFLNMLVNTLTIGIYLPQHVTVTCAAQGSMSAGVTPAADRLLALPPDATSAEQPPVLSTAPAPRPEN